MGVQGTEFDVLALEKETQVFLYEGLLSVASRDPRYPGTVLMQPGDFLRIKLGTQVPPATRFIASNEEAEAVPPSQGSLCLSGDCTQSDNPLAAVPEPPTGPGPRQAPEPNPPGNGPLGQ